MLETLISSTHSVPTLLLMFPAEARGFFGKAKSLFQKEMRLMFVCPVTKKPAKSGPDGLGYRIKVTKEWVKQAAPVLIIALKVVQLAMTAYGIPFPLPTLPADMFQIDFLEIVLDGINSEFDGIEDELTEADSPEETDLLFAYSNVMDALDVAKGNDDQPAIDHLTYHTISA